MGTQDGLAHIALGLANPGDVILVSDPGYPIGLGPDGEGYVRIAMVQKDELLEEAVEHLRRSRLLEALPV